MRVYVVIIAVGMWEKYTKPCIESIKKYEPAIRGIVCVNNGSKITQEQKKEVDGVRFIDIKDLIAYSKAINVGLKAITDDALDSWYIVINNDVLCTNSF